ncbi:MAG: peptide deformylase [Bacteroidota bacterium]
MILPVYAYGHSVLKKKAVAIDKDFPGLQELIANMFETMDKAPGVGLAAPQIGLGIRLFVIDSSQMMEEGEEENGLRMVFINAEKIEERGEMCTYEEGCLSIPEVTGDVDRPESIRLRYQDENFETHERLFTGMNARVIQHEYDHIEGKLFTEYLKPLKRRRIKRKLEKIKRGEVDLKYKMRFMPLKASKKGRRR